MPARLSVVIALVVGLAGAMPGQRPRIGGRMHDFSLTAFDSGNTKVRSASFHGHPLLISFWAAWCPPCRTEMPELDSLVHTYREQGLAVLAVNEERLEVDEHGKAVFRSAAEHDSRLRAFLQRAPLSFPVLLDLQGTVWESFGRPMIPAVVLVDSAGVVRGLYYTGVVTIDSLRAGLRSILPDR
jgi:thiol-disulfide isomerase/thioredoxin